MSDKPSNKEMSAFLAALLITEVIVASGGIMLIDDHPRKRKTWIEKQQARRGW